MARAEPVDKRFYAFRKLSSITPTQFSDHWRREHAELLLSLPDFVERRCDYVQNHFAETGPCGMKPFAFDGVTQVCVRAGAEALPPFPLTEAYLQHIVPDERKFIDRASSITFTTREQVIVPGEGVCKLLILPWGRPELSPEAIDERWLAHHRAQIRRQTGFMNLIRGYRLNSRTSALPCRTMVGDLVGERETPVCAIEMWFDTREGARQALRTIGSRLDTEDDGAPSILLDQSLAAFVNPCQILPA